MDLVLSFCDRLFFTPYVYPSSWSESNLCRQALSLYVITGVGGVLLYLSMASFSYFFIFDRSLKKHQLFLPNQVLREIACTIKAAPFMSGATVPLFLLEVRGYSKLYMDIDGVWGWAFVACSLVAFLMFTDCFIYWIHRGLHHKRLYKYFHKDHHRWKVPTPFASHAFHPLDGFLQSVPYHIYPFLFPLHKVIYLVLFVFVNLWTVSIHDADYRVPALLKPFINGSAHHTDHHLYYNYNYGQFFTLWDHIGGSFRTPRVFSEGITLLDDVDCDRKDKPKGA